MTARGGALCGVALLVAVASRGDTNTPAYTLDECIQIGLARSAAATNAYRDEQIAKALRRQARAEALPSLGVTASYTRLDEVEKVPLGEDVVEAGTLDNYQVEASASQLLYAGGRVNAALRAAGLARDLAGWQRKETEQQLVHDIRVRFLSILLAREAVRVRTDSVAQLAAQADEITGKADAGTVSDFDAISAQVALGNERPKLIRARNDYALAIEDLRRLLNVGPAAFAVKGELSHRPIAGTLAEHMRRARTSRALLHIAATEVGLRREDVVATRAGSLPNLRAIFAYNGANSYRFVEFDEDWQWHWNAILALDWNIWDGGLTLSRVAEKKLELEKSRTNFDDAVQGVELAVRSAFLDLRNAEEAIDAAGGTVALAEKALGIAQSRYESGLSTRLELTEATLAVSQARLAWHRALFEHQVAVAGLALATGDEGLAGGREDDEEEG